MIKKDVRGIFFSIDAGLALIPVLILLLTVSNTNIDYTHTYQEKSCFQKAQDSAELMVVYTGPDNQTILEEISSAISENPDPNDAVESARDIADPFLKKTLGRMNYRLVEINYLKGREIASKGNFEEARDVAVAVKCNRIYLFKLYVWE
ncbi:MAG TPA: hypothetical protein VLM77_01065 [Methanobacterium sp.]|nr:hypothetical protein [Methanobacterium sp.]